jgi:1-acyl-sn-glycerol-3-phosphate acyltransferase
MTDSPELTPDITRPPYWLYLAGRGVVWLVMTIVGRMKVMGREHVPRTGAVILVPNHCSYADPPLVGLAAGRPLRYMAKEELFRIPLFGALIRAVGAFTVHRGTTDRTALRLTLALLAAGEAVIIFAEGKTSLDGKLQAPEMGMALMALKAQAPVIPVAVIDSNVLLPRTKKGMHFAHVRVIFGEPLDFSQYRSNTPSRAVLREVSEITMRRVAELLIANGAPERVPPGYLEREG